MEFWRLVKTPKKSKSIVIKLLRDVDSGYFSAPKAYDSLARYRTEELAYSGPQPLRVDLPEQRLLRNFLRKYPEARSEPIELGSFHPPLARQFVQRQQLAIMSGSDPEEAFAATEVHFAEKLKELRRRHLGSLGGTTPLDLLQQQEQEQLDAGLDALEQQRRDAAAARLEAAGGR